MFIIVHILKRKVCLRQFIDNNIMFISSLGISDNKKKIENRNQNEVKTSLNISRIVVNSFTNSPLPLKAIDDE